MVFKLRNRTKKQQRLIDELIGVIILILAVVGWYLTRSLASTVTIVVLGIGIIILFSLWRSLRFKKRMQQSGIADVDEMTGNEFEEYIGWLFTAQGYNVSFTPTTGDYGADLILKKDKEIVVVQAKRYKQTVGIKAVQEVIPALMMYKATAAWVITNSTYTKQALALAKSNDVRMIDRDELIQISLNLRNENNDSNLKSESNPEKVNKSLTNVIEEDANEIADSLLEKRLKDYRLKTAKNAGLKAYHVFTNETLFDLVAKRPTTINELHKVKGLGNKRIDTYGAELVKVINGESICKVP